MKTLNSLFLSLSLLAVGATACDVQPVSDTPAVTKAEAQAMAGKADGIDFCEVFDWYGDGICDPWCPDPDPDCSNNECLDLGGQCLSSPIDVTFGADCEGDFGLNTVNADCGGVINLTCCVAGDPEPEPEPEPEGNACEAAGGQCLSSPIDVTFGADCEGDFGMETLNEDCGGVINLSCCVPTEPDPEPEPSSCSDMGGQCLSSPLDVTFGADCEGDFGLQTLNGDCPAFNQSCCG